MCYEQNGKSDSVASFHNVAALKNFCAMSVQATGLNYKETVATSGHGNNNYYATMIQTRETAVESDANSVFVSLSLRSAAVSV